MKYSRSILRNGLLGLTFTVLALLPGQDARAQVPPHYPGTICATPTFWCWVAQPGYVGTACACPSVYGWVQGVLI